MNRFQKTTAILKRIGEIRIARPGHRRRLNAGNAMVEFALGAAVLVAVLTGTFRFGIDFLRYNTLQNAVTRGARFASLAAYDSNTSTPSSTFKAAVQNMVVYGSPSPASGASPVLPGLSTSNINLTVTFVNSVPNLMTVSISGYTVDSVVGQVTLTKKPSVTFTYQGIWEPV